MRELHPRIGDAVQDFVANFTPQETAGKNTGDKEKVSKEGEQEQKKGKEGVCYCYCSCCCLLSLFFACFICKV